MSVRENASWKTRLVERGFPDRAFDIEFWQEQGDEAISAAAWEMVELAEEIKQGRKPTPQRPLQLTEITPIVFSDACEKKVASSFFGVPVHFISLDDLVTNQACFRS